MNKFMFAGLAFAAVLAVNTSSGFAATGAENMKACAAQWKQGNNVPAGTTWPSFEKDCMAKLDQASATSAAPAVKVAAPVVAVAPVAPKSPAAPASVAPAAMAAAYEKNCTDQWAQMSAVKKVLSGNTFDTFKVGCMAKLQAAAVAPATPAVAAPAAKMATPMAPVAPAPKGVAPAAPATAAATGGTGGEQSRIKTCAKQWDDMKAAKTTPVGLKWPQYWHECDVKLKAAGL